jgi:hypothetical protein
VNPAGATPTTANETSLIAIVLPMMSGAAAKARVHRPCDSTAAGGAPGRSSRASSSRPTNAGIPSVEKYSPLTIVPKTCSTSPPTRTPKDCMLNAAS